MEEQKNLNNPLANQPEAAATQKNIPTVAGVMIILIVAVLAGAGVFYFFQVNFSEEVYPNSAAFKVPAQKEKSQDSSLENSAEIPAAAEEEIAQPAAGETFNFDYELKKLDDQNNSISSDDFNENEMSDANVGL